jgi:hypothetical protein
MAMKNRGARLIETADWLRDPARRHAAILEATERNSVIEGLPKFNEGLRERIKTQLRMLSPVQSEVQPE